MTQVPVIDISAIRGDDPAAKAALGARVDAVCRSIGFLIVDGHGVPEDVIEAAARTALAFFDRPLDEKCRWCPPEGTILRGYTPPDSNTLALSKGVFTPPDVREQLSFGRPDVTGDEYAGVEAARPFYRPNIWPDAPDGLRPAFEAYAAHMERLARDLMRVFAWALALPERYFDGLIDRNFAALHAMHYPPRDSAPLPDQLRAGAHSDFGSLTILHPTLNGDGLQVHAGDAWIDVDPPPGTFVINLGDLMQQWTNERWVSTLHRVANPPGAESGWRERRLSLGHFCHPNFDALVAALPGCVPPGETARHAPIAAGEYMRRKILAMRHIDPDARTA